MYATVVVPRVRHLAVASLVSEIAICCGCAGFFAQPDPKSTPVNLRIENGASSFVEVTVTVSSEETAEIPSDPSSETSPTGDAEEPAGMPIPSTGPPETSTAETEADSIENETVPGEDQPVEQSVPEGVTIGVPEEVEPKDDASTHAKKGARALKEVVSEMTVRVSPQDYSDGSLLCGDEMTITATISGGQATGIVLEGAGTGTAGFDEGSIGLDGERLLLNKVHFECGDTLVVRVADTGTGEIEVYESGTAPPDPSLGAGASLEPDAEILEFRINNQTASFVELLLSDEQLTSASSDEETTTEDEGSAENGITVRVPPGFLSTGVVSCGPQVILVGTVVVPAVDTESADTFNQVVLTGTGTGTIDFDENSVGPEAYQRLLLEGIHYECGDVIQVDFTSDGNPAGEEPDTGLGTVSIGS